MHLRSAIDQQTGTSGFGKVLSQPIFLATSIDYNDAVPMLPHRWGSLAGAKRGVGSKRYYVTFFQLVL